MAHPRNQPRSGVTRRSQPSQSRRNKTNGGFEFWGKLFKLVGWLGVAGLVWLAWEHLPAREPGPLYPIQYVRVVGGIENLDVAKVQQALKPVVNAGYFSQDMGEVERVVRTFAWVDKVRLTRVWPDALEISVTEQKAAARWGDHALLNPKGIRFTPDNTEAFVYLPVIYGPAGMEAYLLEVLKTLNDKLTSRHVKVAALDLSKRRAWTAKLDNGLELYFGRQEPLGLLERFLGQLPKLGESNFTRLKKVDLRYPNGFAVVWKAEAETLPEVNSENGAASNLAVEKH
jgi:cell division protein FtsQ